MIRRRALGGTRAAASVLAVFALVCAPASGLLLVGGPSGPPRAVAQTAPVAPGQEAEPQYAQVSIGSISPEVVEDETSGGSIAGMPTVTVEGEVTNVGTEPLDEIDVRLQRGPEVGTDDIRDPLVWEEPAFGVAGDFQRIADEIEPGGSRGFRLTMPVGDLPPEALTAATTPGPSLRINEPGVYPLLVNVNGTPRGASAAHLDDARTLLPVLTEPQPPGVPGGDTATGDVTPGDSTTGDTTTGGPGGETTAPPGTVGEEDDDPVPATVLLPFASEPSRFGHLLGGGVEPGVALDSERLLDELRPEGRLTGLLDAATRSFEGPGGEALKSATCLAVDPVLVQTVEEIADGAPVHLPDEDDRTDLPGAPADPASTIDDEPAEVDRSHASGWLSGLRSLASDMCVVPLPAEQADLDAVARVDSAELTGAALDETGSLARVLETEVSSNVIVPATGALGPGTAGVIQRQDSTAIIASNSTRNARGNVPEPGVVELVDSPTNRAVTFDPGLGTALAATGHRPENPHYSDPATRFDHYADSGAARLQNARAALLAPAVDEAAPEAGVLMVPPADWSVDGESAASLLGMVGRMLDSGGFRAEPLSARLAAEPTVPTGSLAPDPTGATDPGRVPPHITDSVAGSMAGLQTLRQLVDHGDPRGVVGDAYLTPLVGDGLRALSGTGRRTGGDGLDPDSGTGAVADERATGIAERLDAQIRFGHEAVDLLPPGSVFTMASSNSPLLLVVRNALPFPVRTGLDFVTPPGLDINPIETVRVPAEGSRTMQIPTENHREDSGRQTVTILLTGTDGQQISPPVEISVQSSGYPLALVFTAGVGILALLLVGRRLLRYRRGTPDPADEGHRP